MDITDDRMGKDQLLVAIDAGEIANGLPAAKPRLHCDPSNPDRTVEYLRDVFAASGQLFDRGYPVRVVRDPTQGGVVAYRLDADAVILMAHKLARPFACKLRDGELKEADICLPRTVACMYLSARGDWILPILSGIASAPLLKHDGTIRSASGYDVASGMWLESVPDIGACVPECPSRADAERALYLLRATFATFCFADAVTLDSGKGYDIVDIGQPPSADESAALSALLTAACRPSLHLAPGALIVAPDTSGSGCGKGLLARCICAVAFGRQPAAITAGAGVEELEKRLAAKMIEGAPAVLIDNVNRTALRSDLLASALSERPAEIRILGRTEMAQVNSTAFIIVTGNGLKVSEDLARRFIEIRLDARTEDPETRPFNGDILAEVSARRAELLAACLTIWKWGRRNTLPSGKALGGYEQWCRWVRDPLLALGCQDPAQRVSEAKTNDPHRQRTVDIYEAWWKAHGDGAVKVAELAQDLVNVIDPHHRGRQYVTAVVSGLEGARVGGFVLTRQPASGKWGAATYSLKLAGGGIGHRDHREHRPEETSPYFKAAPMPPMPPMPPTAAGANGCLRGAACPAPMTIREKRLRGIGGLNRGTGPDLKRQEDLTMREQLIIERVKGF